jgi:hypothetical protein
MVCPRCNLINPEGSLHCDCGFHFDMTPTATSLGTTTLSFVSSTGEAARAIVSTFGWAILIVTLAWGYARMNRWLCDSLRFSDGTTARFIADPKRIWFVAMLVGLFPQMDKWVTRIIVSQTDEGSARSALFWIFLLGFWSAQTIVWLKIWKWMVVGISLSSGIIFDFDGGAITSFGMVSVSNILAALLLPTRGLILLAFVPLMYWYIRWWIGHVHSGYQRLRFVGSLGQAWWRILAAMIISVLIVTIPWVMIWIYKWVIANIRIESEERSVRAALV